MPRAPPLAAAPKRPLPTSPTPTPSPPNTSTTTTTTSSRRQPLPAHARQRIALACDQCRAKKSRCDGRSPECRGCLSAGRECTYSKSGKKRGLAPGHTHRLELRVAMMEGLLGLLLCPDPGSNNNNGTSTNNALGAAQVRAMQARDRELEDLVRRSRDRLREGRELRAYWTQSAARGALAEACGGEDGPLGALARKARRRRTNTVATQQEEEEDDFFGRAPHGNGDGGVAEETRVAGADAEATPRPASVVPVTQDESMDDVDMDQLASFEHAHQQQQQQQAQEQAEAEAEAQDWASQLSFSFPPTSHSHHHEAAHDLLSTPRSSAATLTETETETWVDFSLAGDAVGVGFPGMMMGDDEDLFATVVDVDRVDAVDENWDGFMRQQREEEALAEERKGVFRAGGGGDILIPW